ncbi:MAG: iron-sulfur cluster assembly protein [Verrucomicrobiota bacterium]
MTNARVLTRRPCVLNPSTISPTQHLNISTIWLEPTKNRSTAPQSVALPTFDLAKRADTLKSMINVTDDAVRQLRILLKEKAGAAQKGLRVQIVKGGCSGLNYEMALDEQKPGDAVVERDGVEFYIDKESAGYLRDATLDFRDGLTAVGFQIVNPNAARTCGCGSSFEAAKPA